jgi:hypothetical protein
MTTVIKSIPAKNLPLLLNDLDGMKIAVSIGFSKDIARVWFKRRHMKRLLYADTSRYYRN